MSPPRHEPSFSPHRSKKGNSFLGPTSPPSAAMQADMDMLSRKAGLDPAKYQMQWVNLDSYPDP